MRSFGQKKVSGECGNISIILCGRYKSRRVITLDIFSSSCLLVVGPNLINGVPCKRVGSRFLLITSARLHTFPNYNFLLMKSGLNAKNNKAKWQALRRDQLTYTMQHLHHFHVK
jgi:ribosomal protein L14E/L6E/L27E